MQPRTSSAMAKSLDRFEVTRCCASASQTSPSLCCIRATTTTTSSFVRTSTGAGQIAIGRADDQGMLSLIRVKNYAIVDEVELELDRGFSVVTGETGAGKSILVDALGLALGDRAEADTVRAGSERAEISVQ